MSIFMADPYRRDVYAFPTRRSSDLAQVRRGHADHVHHAADLPDVFRGRVQEAGRAVLDDPLCLPGPGDEKRIIQDSSRSEEHTSELQSRENLVCRLLLEKKKL